jgi:hypothetical protein
MARPIIHEPRFNKTTSDGYFITIDGRTIEDAGKSGIIHGKARAQRLRDVIARCNPGKNVELWSGHMRNHESL